ncbi:hypothetical protein [Streptomyces sp. NPDC048309]|uniref:hypothetical protein n=1 Tax=Streptomyces sp. NPDC048309 TaxID=3154618 RepID=UPI0033E97D55
MANAGIVQDGDPVLTRAARPFDLPAEAEEAREVITELMDAVGRVRQLHTFGKGMGIAAPPRSGSTAPPPLSFHPVPGQSPSCC